MAANENGRLSLLGMPGEIRNNIYHDLRDPRPEHEERDEVIPACGPSGYHHLLPLMRTCRQIHNETTPLLFTPTYTFLTSPAELDFNIPFILYLAGIHLRTVRIQYDAQPFFTYRDTRYERSRLDISMLISLATACPNLQTLEIRFTRTFKVYGTRWFHPVFEIKEYSWVDEPMELPFGGYEGLREDEEQVKKVERELRTDERYLREVWKKLIMFEDHKRFFGGEVVGVLKRMKGLRERQVEGDSICGPKDEKSLDKVRASWSVGKGFKVLEEAVSGW
ncbi:hypothetical protein QBC34DRAFT_496353 [Podospora aff. communis PSN243]|uniref:F-box domain-containing protein n=1 Tax=Podospora aff. communis PSN243 TaxID=3040156 RepID=A0AAV9GIR1_9PEZI|nr:hypothetical protein QBC34DRAFT_496353 [Podospora aff. communis PSN243]